MIWLAVAFGVAALVFCVVSVLDHVESQREIAAMNQRIKDKYEGEIRRITRGEF